MTKLFRGAKVSKRPDGEASPVLRSIDRERTVNGSAYELAKANRHKPWARRWLKQNGHWI
jgi:hypothetical protein